MDKKIGYVEKKVPHVTGLATTDVLNTKISWVENKIPGVTELVEKLDCDAKTKDIERKYFE